MSEFLYIILNISLPIIIIIIVGFGIEKIFKPSVEILVKINVYVMLPCMMFQKIYTMELTEGLLLKVVPYVLILMTMLFLISQLISFIMRYKKPMRKAMGNTFMLINTGNYGVPLIELAFPGSVVAMASQLIIIAVQNIVTGTFVVFQASSGKYSTKQSLKNVIKMPVLYAIALAIILRSVNVEIPVTIKIPLEYVTASFIAFALLTLGARLGEIKNFKGMKNVAVGSLIRMLCVPILAFAIVKLLGITGVLAQALIIGVSTPAAVNSAIIAKEFDNEPDFAAQFVLATTVLCTFTLPLVIYVVPKIL